MRRWLQPPRHLLMVLGAITLASAGTLAVVAWELLERDADVESQRAHERLEHQADLAVQSLERTVADVEARLADWTARPSGSIPNPGIGRGIMFSSQQIETAPGARLLFYPFLPGRAEPPAALFADAEILEYRKDYARATQTLRQGAASADPPVRAAALMRLGRVLRASGELTQALSVYQDMVTLGETPVAGLPAELVARGERVEILEKSRRRDQAATEARALLTDLLNSRWSLARGQFEFYADRLAARSAGLTAGPVDLGIAEATEQLWLEWSERRLAPNGRRPLRLRDASLLACWRSAPDRLALWLAPPGELLKTVANDTVTLALSDADGTVSGILRSGGLKTTRSPTDTRLPWTLHAQMTVSAQPDAGLTRGQLIALVLGVILVFLVAGSYFVARAIKREMDLARLQSDFVSAVSHEFRTPLAGMRQLAELLAAGRVRNDERRQHYYESLAGESRRLQRLVENLLDFGRLQAGARPYQLEPLDPRTLVEQVVDDFRAQPSHQNCQIEVDGDPGADRLMGDREAVALALQNLLDNAVKYGGDGGVLVSWARHGDRIALRVRDRGPGIPAGEHQRIFDRFVRGTTAASAHVRGTGIGLAMVKQVVNGHGGDVTVESEPGAGSIFTLWFPVMDPPL